MIYIIYKYSSIFFDPFPYWQLEVMFGSVLFQSIADIYLYLSVLNVPETMQMIRGEKWLRLAFLVGAVMDAITLVPMLIPEMATAIWGVTAFTGSYFLAMGYGASLMLGWTLLLAWAYRKPMERRFVAVLTVIVVAGLFIAEAYALVNGHITADKFLPTTVIKGLIIALFGFGYVATLNRGSD